MPFYSNLLVPGCFPPRLPRDRLVIQIFIPNTPEPDKPPLERRRHPRHQYLREISICPQNGIEFTGTTFEISQSGMSLATPNFLRVGDLVELFPILDQWVKAVVMRKVGAMYGFQFLDLTEKQTDALKTLCESLPLFTTMADI